MHIQKILLKFALAKPQQGSLAEWLGTGLQNRLQQFDSARNLKIKPAHAGFVVYHLTKSLFMEEKPLIFISNDDSINAPGLRRLVDCVKCLGDVVVVAPELPQSGMSSAMTINSPLRVKQYDDYNGAKMYSVNGTPVDCVKLPLHTSLDRMPNLVVTGINHGSNAGNNILYSGTMGAAFEGAMVGIPSIGFSILSHSMDVDFSHCAPHITNIARKILENGLPYRTCLNVNFPVGEIKGIKVVRTAISHWTEEYMKYTDPHGKDFYWLTGSIINEEPDCDETDLYWLDRGYATIVPAQTSQDATALIEPLKKIF